MVEVSEEIPVRALVCFMGSYFCRGFLSSRPQIFVGAFCRNAFHFWRTFLSECYIFLSELFVAVLHMFVGHFCRSATYFWRTFLSQCHLFASLLPRITSNLLPRGLCTCSVSDPFVLGSRDAILGAQGVILGPWGHLLDHFRARGFSVCPERSTFGSHWLLKGSTLLPF